MEYVTIVKGNRTKRMTRNAWENNMPANKDGWTIKPEAPKELKGAKPLQVIHQEDENLSDKDETIDISDEKTEDTIKPEEPKGEQKVYHNNNKGFNKNRR